MPVLFYLLQYLLIKPAKALNPNIRHGYIWAFILFVVTGHGIEFRCGAGIQDILCKQATRQREAGVNISWHDPESDRGTQGAVQGRQQAETGTADSKAFTDLHSPCRPNCTATQGTTPQGPRGHSRPGEEAIEIYALFRLGMSMPFFFANRILVVENRFQIGFQFYWPS